MNASFLKVFGGRVAAGAGASSGMTGNGVRGGQSKHRGSAGGGTGGGSAGRAVGGPREGLGVALSVFASLSFGGVFFVTPLLHPASPQFIWAARTLATVLMLGFVLFRRGQRRELRDLLGRVRRRPVVLGLSIAASGLLVSSQLWIFSWAPTNGQGMEVALGYFLLPLVLAFLGRLFFSERMVWWQWVAAGLATVGVVAEVVRAGGVSPIALAVAFGYGSYFMLRRALGYAGLAGMFLEFLVVSPFAIFFLFERMFAGPALSANPNLAWLLPLFAVWSTLSLLLYMAASKILSFSVFGLLSYLEPALLAVAAWLMGERLSSGELFSYASIWAAVLVLALGGLARVFRAAGRRGGG